MMASMVTSSKCHSASGASAAAAIVPRSISGARLNNSTYKGQMKRCGGMERSKNSVVVKAAKSKAPEEPKIVSPTQGEPEWFALVARAEFFFNDVQNEALAEQLRELKRYYEENDREQDFFFVCEPEWLDKFPEAKAVKRPAVALVTTDKNWAVFMKLRLDRVLRLDLGNMSIDKATKSTAEVPEFEPIKEWTAPYSPYSKGWWEVFMR